MNKLVIGGLTAGVILIGGYAFASTAHLDIANTLVDQFEENIFEPNTFTYSDVSSSLLANTMTVKDVTVTEWGKLENVKFDSITFELDGYTASAKLVGYVATGMRVNVEEESEKVGLSADELIIRFPDGTPWNGVNGIEDFPTMSASGSNIGLSVEAAGSHTVTFKNGGLSVNYDDQSGQVGHAEMSATVLEGESNGLPFKGSIDLMAIESFQLRDFVSTIAKLEAQDTGSNPEVVFDALPSLIDPLIGIERSEMKNFQLIMGNESSPFDAIFSIKESLHEADNETGRIVYSGYKDLKVKGKAQDGTSFDISLDEYSIEGMNMGEFFEFAIAMGMAQEGIAPLSEDAVDGFVESFKTLFGVKRGGLKNLVVKIDAPASQTKVDLSIDRVGIYDTKFSDGFMTEAKVDLGPIRIKDAGAMHPQAAPLLALFQLPSDIDMSVLSTLSYDPSSSTYVSAGGFALNDYISTQVEQSMTLTSYRDYMKAALLAPQPDPNAAPEVQVQQMVLNFIQQMQYAEDFDIDLAVNNDGGVPKLINGFATMNGMDPAALSQQVPVIAAQNMQMLFPNMPPEELLALMNTFFGNAKSSMSLSLGLQGGKTGADIQSVNPTNFPEILDIKVKSEAK